MGSNVEHSNTEQIRIPNIFVSPIIVQMFHLILDQFISR